MKYVQLLPLMRAFQKFKPRCIQLNLIAAYLGLNTLREICLKQITILQKDRRSFEAALPSQMSFVRFLFHKVFATGADCAQHSID